MKKLIVCLSTLLILLGGCTNARQLGEASDAYNKGDFAQAFKLFQPLADQGDADAQFKLGDMYRSGQGVTQDYGRAADWYRKAAEQGDAVAQFNLGLLYAQGLGVLKDYVRAHMWLNLAAAKGNSDFVKNRGLVESKMTQSQIAEAQKLARECERREYRYCD